MVSIAAVVFWSALGVLAYTYCVFPLVLAFAARLIGAGGKSPRDKPADPLPDDLPSVTMVVAAYNEGAVLGQKLANTAKIDYPQDRFQVLIGSDGSSDETVRILQQYCNQDSTEPTSTHIRYHAFEQRRGKISVLNDLLAEVDSQIVVMSDANTMFAPDAIRMLVRHFEDPRVGCVSGELSLDQEGGVSGEGLYWKYEGWIKRNESRLGFLIGCNGGIFALRRELYAPLPPNTIVEDFVLTLRVIESGHLVRLEPAARATEPACASSKAEMVRKVRIGAGGWQALGLNGALLHPRFGLCAFAFWGHKVFRWLAPCFIIAALIANIALALSGSAFYTAVLALQLVGAAIAALAYRAGHAKPLPRWTRPFSYFYLMHYALFCGLLRHIFKKQRVTWERAAP